MLLIKERVPSWSTADRSNHSSDRQQGEGKGVKGNVRLAQWILTSQSQYSMSTYVCMHMYVCVRVYVNSTCWQGNLLIIFPSSPYFAAILFRG